jgi:hypothetical protein
MDSRSRVLALNYDLLGINNSGKESVAVFKGLQVFSAQSLIICEPEQARAASQPAVNSPDIRS